MEIIIKRDGSEQPFQPSKLNRWGEWAADTLGDKVDWSTAVLETIGGLGKKVTSTELQHALIKTCLDFDTWSWNRMAGRLYAALKHKDIYPNGFPTVQEQHQHLQQLGLMEVLDYSDSEYAIVQTFIDHQRDFSYAHYQIHTHLTKYAITDRVNGINYETSQFMYMRMAMAIAESLDKSSRMQHVKKLYEHLSMGRINAPTPNHVNLGTPLKGYASCCLYTTGDSARSIAIGNHIANTMTYMSAGIGAHINTRSVNDPVRGGVIRHQGKLPYLRAIVGEVKANLQNGRGGACTTHFTIYDPEVETLLRLKNPMSTEDKKIRGMDYSWGGNKFFARKVAKNEDVFMFNSFTAPDLYDALYSGNEELFEEVYNRYLEDNTFEKKFVNARELLITACNEWNETGRIYEHNLTEMNTHTPFNDTIYSSNLCQEIALPTGAYNDMRDLYLNKDVTYTVVETDDGSIYRADGEILNVGDTFEGHVVTKVTESYSPEVAMCNLGGICVDKIESDEQYAEVAYYTLLMIDKCIHDAHYELPHIGFTSKARLNAGVGIIGLAHLMAKKNKLYSTKEGKQFIYSVAERHYYHMLRASLKLGQQFGNAPWIDRTKWPKGWLPIDTANPNVEALQDFTRKYDWEQLRAEIIENGGIRNSVLACAMPSESSANASGTTNGVYPIRELTMIKTDNQRVNYWAAPEGDSLEQWYESAWDIPTKDLTDAYAIIQAWTDQGISADFYRVVIGDATISSTELIKNYLYRVKMGLKTKYYMNQKTSNGMKAVEDDANCESCTL